MAIIRNSIDKDTYEKIQNLVFELDEYASTELDDDEDDTEYLSYNLIVDKSLNNLIVMSCYHGFFDEEIVFYKFEDDMLIKTTSLEDDLLRKIDKDTPFLNQNTTYFLAQRFGQDETLGQYRQEVL